jgi:hypothetical protein
MAEEVSCLKSAVTYQVKPLSKVQAGAVARSSNKPLRPVLAKVKTVSVSTTWGGKPLEVSAEGHTLISLSLSAFNKEILQAFKDSIPDCKRGTKTRFLTQLATSRAAVQGAAKKRKTKGSDAKAQLTDLKNELTDVSTEISAVEQTLDHVLESLTTWESLGLVAAATFLNISRNEQNVDVDIFRQAVRQACFEHVKVLKRDMILWDVEGD